MNADKKKKSNGLPKGFEYQEKDGVMENYTNLEIFIKSSSGSYARLVEFPPVSFLEQFKRGANITGDKVYDFEDKKGRTLVLTPDSQAHTFNYYIHSSHSHNSRNLKFSWICPIFRYRHIPVRYYYQYGYTSINHKKSENINELVSLVHQLVKYIQNLTDGQISIHIVNPTLVKEVRVVHGDTALTMNTDAVSNTFNSEEFLSTYGMCSQAADTVLFFKLLSQLSDIQAHISMSAMYCQEILSGPGFIIHVNGEKVGDGGIYDKYGYAYDGCIRTVASVCVASRLLKNVDRKKFIPLTWVGSLLT